MLAALLVLAAAPAFAQFGGVDVRPYVQASEQRFTAQQTFNATFQSSAAPFWGGGVDVVLRKRFFVDVAVSRVSKTGQRAFINNGDVFRLGIPLRISVTPIELTGGYRFRAWKSRVLPYAGAGIGSYAYTETSDFSTAGEDVNTRRSGFVLMGGAEIRVAKWVAVAGDAHYARVPGILGQGGISKDVGEHDLGGVAARVRVMLGR